jgi:hypothetical protein
MPAPMLPIFVAVAGLAALALSKKSATGATATASGTVPSYPGAAGALSSAAGSLSAPVAAAPAPVAAPAPFLPAAPVAAAPAPVAVAPPPADGTVTVLPVTIVGQPTPTSAPTPAQVAPWDASSMVLPAPSSLPAIPGTYAEQSQETQDVQTALNNWAASVGFQAVDANGANVVPLSVDGLYGPDTQLVASGFQTYSNATANSGLAVDGLAGPLTQTPLLDWGTISPGGPY